MVLFFISVPLNKALKTAFLSRFLHFYYFSVVSVPLNNFSALKYFNDSWNDLERFRTVACMVRAFARVCMVFAWVGSWQLVAYRCRAGRSLRRVLPR